MGRTEIEYRLKREISGSFLQIVVDDFKVIYAVALWSLSGGDP